MYTQLCEAETLLRSIVEPQQLALARILKAKESVEGCRKRGVQQAIKEPFATVPPACEHRRAHRPGRPRKIDRDPELRAFIQARINRMTFNDVADAVAKAFPPARRIGKSAIYDWWKDQNPAL